MLLGSPYKGTISATCKKEHTQLIQLLLLSLLLPLLLLLLLLLSSCSSSSLSSSLSSSPLSLLIYFIYFILFYFIITLGIHLQYSYTVLTYNKTTKFTYVTALLLTTIIIVIESTQFRFNPFIHNLYLLLPSMCQSCCGCRKRFNSSTVHHKGSLTTGGKNDSKTITQG